MKYPLQRSRNPWRNPNRSCSAFSSRSPGALWRSSSAPYIWGLVAYFSNSVYVIIAFFIGLAVASAILIPISPIHKAVALIFLPIALAGTLLSILLGESLFTVLVLMRDYEATVPEALTAVVDGIGEVLAAKDALLEPRPWRDRRADRVLCDVEGSVNGSGGKDRTRGNKSRRRMTGALWVNHPIPHSRTPPPFPFHSGRGRIGVTAAAG